ncbi:IX [Bat mastadenovirus WIV12]|uniref:IX n=1 Tax=Bat mastadenovirus WIV12 TaxID=1788434 RepID=A0A1B0UHZ7_9ADEN|nr:IX [Bat mastadenovirus WIV12]AMB43146.1 IX [Bat mastadenovirus WIV12]
MSVSYAGAIQTAFVTRNLPRWAGVPQDVIGSDLGGKPVLPTNAMAEMTAGGELLKEVELLRRRLMLIEQKLKLLEARARFADGA